MRQEKELENRQKQTVVPAEGFLKPELVKKALEDFADAVRESHLRPREPKIPRDPGPVSQGI